jgi:hypothetical protein
MGSVCIPTTGHGRERQVEATHWVNTISRYHLQGKARIPGLEEVPVKRAQMKRRLVVTYRAQSFLSPAAKRLLELFEQSSAQA